MRIISLLPSATEIVFNLGLGDHLVGVSFECDYPAEAGTLPVVSRTSLPDGLDLSALDTAVTGAKADAHSLYAVNEELVRELNPDLVLTQDTCDVCAIDSQSVVRSLHAIGCDAEVVSISPRRLDDVIESVRTVATAAGVSQRGDAVVAGLNLRLNLLREQLLGAERVRTLVLEWTDPAYNAGHWVPDMVAAAGGEPLLAEPGEYSVPISWDDVAAAAPDVVIVAPCGFGLDDASEQAHAARTADALAATPAGSNGQVWAVDASGYFARPGPRIVDGVETLAAILHPDRVAAVDTRRARQVDVSAAPTGASGAP